MLTPQLAHTPYAAGSQPMLERVVFALLMVMNLGGILMMSLIIGPNRKGL